ALAINNRGQIVGFSLNTIPDPFSTFDIILNLILGTHGGTQTRAALWQHGEMQDLGTLGGNDAAAFYINDHGQVAGVSYTSTVPNPVTGVPPQEPFLWENGHMVDLGTLGGAYGLFSGQGGGLNNRGQVIGVSSVAANPGACFFTEFDPNCHPFLWGQGTLIDLNTNTRGGNPLSADGINDAGEVVGAADFSGFGGSAFDAYLLRNSVAFDLGDAPGDCFSRALAINSKGQVVGNSFSCDGNFDRAFLWENGSIIDLNSVIPAGSPLELVTTNDINDRGEIAGEGLPSGCSDFTLCVHAFLLIPCDENHPGIEGCDYSTVDATVQPPASAVAPTVPRPMLPFWLSRRNSRFHVPAIHPRD
ncbi:MAG TPA: hypothetical protein VJQ54_19790, partial [Candidatus Sulfotelmatobacter sp.]|nr:hypothetical protein [Candidatus Sulfotelmatobacter sp.]